MYHTIHFEHFIHLFNLTNYFIVKYFAYLPGFDILPNALTSASVAQVTKYFSV